MVREKSQIRCRSCGNRFISSFTINSSQNVNSSACPNCKSTVIEKR